ncbi:DeoR/GlpR family DNA-binding transcription regulator [Acinetobacter boissieri]|uniref:Transcriptional regulator, DeoR family n=1 Tax=Acinetobacter boissieri TaxID=1219383 RepID=A0A1G6GXK4_9GAMM|nr:DeoR/GlpR family DNA-binding transcription regulator [Acinetobacter boissieri]SDB85866.1 transcriptional regulator, DeoR family [Acinetobacter boissieri]
MSKIRQHQLLEIVKKNGYTSIEQLAVQLECSQPTIRRDITKLCNDNLLQRFHGGVSLIHSNDVRLGHTFKSSYMVKEKSQIAQYLLEKIKSIESVFLDTGTTCDQVAYEMNKLSNKQVITHNLSAALILAKQDKHTVIVLGGIIRGSDGAVTGDETYRQIKTYIADMSIVSASGLDLTGNVLDFDLEKVEVKKSMMRASTTRILLLSSDKFRKTGVKIVASITDFDYLITDQQPEPAYTQMLKANRVKLIVA